MRKLLNEEIIIICNNIIDTLLYDTTKSHYLCIRFRIEISHYLPKPYLTTTSLSISEHIPEFTKENARKYGHSKILVKGTEESSWWIYSNIHSRITFVNWIKQQYINKLQ